MKIVFLGSGEFGLECLNTLARSNHNIRFIVTQPPHPAGRGRKPTPTPVARWADSNSVPYIETDNVNSLQMIREISACEPDLIVVIAFGQKIGKELIGLPPKGAINVHASLLPKYRGAAPINWPVINGDKQTGVSIIALAEKMDAGDILAQSATDIGPEETAGRLHDRLAQTAAPLLMQTIDQIANGTAVYTPQDHSGATLAPKLKKSDGFLDFNEPAEVLQRKIRGFWPWPGASAMYISKITGKPLRVTVAMAQVVKTSNPAHLPTGTLDENLDVICARDALKITEIKPTGSRLMGFRDFVNGHQTQAGDSFISP
jgi:methionyl-tRNA formyltransferase